jgi:catechol 2,3-dioxygenase-like lactoylglutathione lyase family enzyme
VVVSGLFRKVDCVVVRVPRLDDGITFYRSLGHELLWRTDSAAGLALPESEAELVVQVERPSPETDLTVDDVEHAVAEFVASGGHVVAEPFDIAIGKCAVIADPWDNRFVILDNSRGRFLTDEVGNVTGLASDESP